MSKWSDSSMLVRFNNPTKEGYEIRHETDELTFLGQDGKPDFAHIILLFYPAKWIIELKSLKIYFYQFRTKVISYERLINIIYDDIMKFYKPKRLRLLMETNIRGGIHSILKIDSDWAIRGGKEEFKDWTHFDR